METERLILRRFTMEDAEKCFEYFGQDKVIGRYIPMFPVCSMSAMEEMVRGFCNNSNVWLIEEKCTGIPMGYVSVDIPYEVLGIGEIAYLLGEKFWHKGYAQEAVRRIIQYLFDEKELYMIEAKVNESNIASKILLQKLNFKQDGILRQRRIDFMLRERNNLIVYSILKEEYKIDKSYENKLNRS